MSCCPTKVCDYQGYAHKVIDHAERYVDGKIHTNGMENFWWLLKRGLNGTYVSVEPFHLFRYLDEQAWRYNNRATKDNPMNDSDRFDLAVPQIVGKRLTLPKSPARWEKRWNLLSWAVAAREARRFRFGFGPRRCGFFAASAR